MCKEYLAIQDPERKASLIRRLKEKISINEETGCLEWIAKAVNNGGYGNISAGRAFVGLRAHRLVWVLKNNQPIPDGMVIMHSCDNPKCCNIDHLSIGTKKQNTEDMYSKGRESKPPTHFGEDHPLRKNPSLAARGSRNGNSVLNEEKVKEIFCSDLSLSQLAVLYVVSKSTIHGIKRRKTWRGVTDNL